MNQWDVCLIFRPLPTDPDRVIFALPTSSAGPREIREKSITIALKVIRGSVDYYRRSEKLPRYSWRYWIVKTIKGLSRLLESTSAYQSV